MNPIDDLVLSGIDQFTPIIQAQKDLLQRVDEITEEAVRTGNSNLAFNAMDSLLGISRISGIAFSKFVYNMKAQWVNFGERGTFDERAEERLGKDKVTLERYHRLWSMFVSGDVPKEYVEKFKTMPVRVLFPIATMWYQDYEVSDTQWRRLSNAPDPTTVSKILREIKGTEPKAGAINIEWYSEQRELQIWKDGKSHTVYLQYDEKDEVIIAGLDRLFSGKVLEK